MESELKIQLYNENDSLDKRSCCFVLFKCTKTAKLNKGWGPHLDGRSSQDFKSGITPSL